MNLDELIGDYSKSTLIEVRELASHLRAWKSDDRDVSTLEDCAERYFENVRIASKEVFDLEYGKWNDFRTEAIGGIGGMTINERLYWFCLADRFALLSNDNERDEIYRKINGRRT